MLIFFAATSDFPKLWEPLLLSAEKLSDNLVYLHHGPRNNLVTTGPKCETDERYKILLRVETLALGGLFD